MRDFVCVCVCKWENGYLQEGFGSAAICCKSLSLSLYIDSNGAAPSLPSD